MNEKFLYFNNVKFTRDDTTGYYLNSTIRKRMHRYVWEYYNGEIPKGYHIHHVDGDKSNNSIENLRLVEAKKHCKAHSVIHAINDYDRMVENLMTNAIPKSKEWHASKEGHEWHKRHYDRMKDKLYVEKEYKCKQCGKKFTSTMTESKFCSNKCKSKWRREQGLDNEERTCEMCGTKFTINKYSKTKCCSRKCAAQLRKNKKNNV